MAAQHSDFLCLQSGKGAELGAPDDFAQVLNVE